MILDKITDLINTYANDRDTLDVEDFQNIRDDLSVNLFALNSIYADAKTAYEAAQYRKKMCLSEITLRLKGTRDEYGKVHTRETVQASAILECEELHHKEFEALKEYERLRQIVTSVGQVLNTISSRLNMMSR